MMSEESKFVYFRDQALELGMKDAYELQYPEKPHGLPIDPSNPHPQSPINYYTNGDLAIWNYIIKNK